MGEPEMAATKIARDQLIAFVDRIEAIEGEIKELNSDKSDIYHEAKSSGFDVKAIKAVVAYRRKSPTEAAEERALFEHYLDVVGVGTANATRVRAREAA